MGIEAQPWSLELLFLDGKTDGMQTAKARGWNVDILLTPRTRIDDALNRQEARRTGVYLLLGESDDGNHLLYIGQSKNVAGRVKKHTTEKDWWTTAVFITASDNSLNTAHVQHMEHKLCEIAQSVGTATLKNGNEPRGVELSEADEYFVRDFISRLMKILPAVRIDVFLERVRAEVNLDRAGKESLPVFKLRNADLNVDATAILENGEIVVQEGSVARKEWESQDRTHSYAMLTKELHRTGVLHQKPDHAVFTCNYAFSSPSAAAAVVRGTPASGLSQWKLKGTEKTYREWEAEQIENKTPELE